MKGVILASPASGAGKTLVTLSLLRALKNRGVALAAAKAGPDYIDPAFHQAACGVTSFNLDSWAMRPDLVNALVADSTQDGRMLVVEAMMGLFDGAEDGTGSAAMLARMLGLPVILVIDCARLSHSVAPLVHGFNSYWPDISIAGLILNRVGSDRHEAMLRDALAALNIPVIGVLRRDQALLLPERHLGLVQASEHDGLEGFIDHAARFAASGMDMEQLLQIGSQAEKKSNVPATVSYLAPLGNHIAVACDDAFRFAYPHILAGWRSCGAAISFFSPLADESPAPHADAVYLPGGYPELYAGRLAAASCFRQAMQQAAEKNCVIYGECGGYMVLGRTLEDAHGDSHEMLGLLPLATSFKKPKLHLGYRRLEPAGKFLWQKNLRGHEFHYATTLWQSEASPLFRTWDALDNDFGTAGLQKGSVAGSFIHVIDIEGESRFE